jgi:hypothetical protein
MPRRCCPKTIIPSSLKKKGRYSLDQNNVKTIARWPVDQSNHRSHTAFLPANLILLCTDVNSHQIPQESANTVSDIILAFLPHIIHLPATWIRCALAQHDSESSCDDSAFVFFGVGILRWVQLEAWRHVYLGRAIKCTWKRQFPNNHDSTGIFPIPTCTHSMSPFAIDIILHPSARRSIGLHSLCTKYPTEYHPRNHLLWAVRCVSFFFFYRC